MRARRGGGGDWRLWLSRREARAGARLLAAHLPLVGATIRRTIPAAVVEARGLADDLWGAGAAALARALGAFDPARGPFETQAIGYIRGALWACVREDDYLSRHYREVAPGALPPGLRLRPASLDLPRRRPGGPEGGPPPTLADTLPAPDDTAAAALGRLEAARVRAAVARLPERERVVVVRRYWGGLSLRECGAGLGPGGADVSAARADHLRRQALARLRRKMGG